MKARIIRLEYAVHAHATEDIAKVRQALLNLLPPSIRSKISLSETTIEGHYSNPIRRITANVEGDDAIEALKYLGSKLNEYDKKMISYSMELRYDPKAGRLYLRFNKQDAYLGRVRLYEGDDIVRVVIVFQGEPSIEEVLEALKEVGLVS